MSEFRADLHCHTTCSDGSLSPAEVVALAKEKGLAALSITDHDTVEAYKTAAALCKKAGITLLPGVEFSASLDGVSVHILGYGFDPENPVITAFCARHADRRRDRNEAILKLLSKHGMPISNDDIISVKPSEIGRSIGRPHIALAMVSKGYVHSPQEAFKHYLGEGKPCYSPGTPFSVSETIDIVHRAKGLAVIAHPHLVQDIKTINALLELNFDGIECFYSKFPLKDNERWLKIAHNKGWLVTGGSDFHGAIKPNIPLGCSWVNEQTFSVILNRSTFKL